MIPSGSFSIIVAMAMATYVRHLSHTGLFLEHWSGMMTEAQALLYRIMMECQNRGTFTEQNLLDFAPHFWYNGTIGENYSPWYVRKRARGA